MHHYQCFLKKLKFKYIHKCCASSILYVRRCLPVKEFFLFSLSFYGGLNYLELFSKSHKIALYVITQRECSIMWQSHNHIISLSSETFFYFCPLSVWEGKARLKYPSGLRLAWVLLMPREEADFHVVQRGIFGKINNADVPCCPKGDSLIWLPFIILERLIPFLSWASTSLVISPALWYTEGVTKVPSFWDKLLAKDLVCFQEHLKVWSLRVLFLEPGALYVHIYIYLYINKYLYIPYSVSLVCLCLSFQFIKGRNQYFSTPVGYCEHMYVKIMKCSDSMVMEAI